MKATKQVGKVKLTEKEYKLVILVCREKTNAEIAELFDIALRSVEKIKTRIYRKTGVTSSIGLFKWALLNKLYVFPKKRKA